MSAIQSRSRGTRRIVQGVIILILVSAVFLSLKRLLLPAVTEVPPERLTLIASGISVDGATNAPPVGFLIERYDTGLLKSRTGVTNGVLEGLSEGWYTNGQKQVEERFQSGVSHGLRVKWYENGQKQSEAAIVNGKIVGVFKRWHDNGVLAEEIAMKDGQPDGLSRAYYPSGCLKAEANMRAGKAENQRFWKDGEKKSSALSKLKELVKQAP